MVQQLLGTLHSDGALARNKSGLFKRRGQRGGFIVADLADEANLQGLGSAKVAGRQRDVLHPREAADDLGQARQRADVCGQADVDLLDSEAGVLGADAHVRAA